MRPSLAMLELSSIARAAVVLDALTKQAMVHIEHSSAVSPGKFLLLFSGAEAEVQEAYDKGRSMAGRALLDQLLLPQVHSDVLPLFRGTEQPLVADESLLIAELGSVPSALLALDASLKAAWVQGKKLRAANGIGGKAYFVLGGSLDAVQAAEATLVSVVQPAALLACEQIARVSPDITVAML